MRSMYLSAGILLLSLTGAWIQFTAEPDKIGTDEVLIMAGILRRGGAGEEGTKVSCVVVPVMRMEDGWSSTECNACISSL